MTNNTVSAKKKKQHRHNAPIEKKLSLPIQSRSKLIGNLLWEKVPFIFLTIASSIVTIWAQHREVTSLEKLPFSDRITNAIVSYVAYLGKTFWPFDLAVLYPYESTFQLWQIFGAISLLLGISAAVIYLIKKTPFLFVGWFWYIGTLIPVIGLVQVGIQSMADRYTYLPSIGIGIMLAWSIPFLIKREEIQNKMLFPAGVVTLAILSFLTWQQCGYWKNSISLFNHVLHVTKNNYVAHNSLGLALADDGKIDQAITHFLAALKIRPDKDNHLAHNNLGLVLAKDGKIDQAITHFLAALKIRPDDDDVHYNLAKALKEQGKFDEAIVHYRETLRINPYYINAHNNLANILCDQKKYNESIYHFRQALQINPNNPDFHFNLGIALSKRGDLNEAIEHFRQAVYLNPDYEDARQALKFVLSLEQKQKR